MAKRTTKQKQDFVRYLGYRMAAVAKSTEKSAAD
jgi:hypothetical protein